MKNGQRFAKNWRFLLIRWFGSLGQSFGIGRTLIFSLIKSLLSRNFCQKRRVNFCNFCTIYVISMVEYTKYVVKRTKNLQKWSFQVYNLHKKNEVTYLMEIHLLLGEICQTKWLISWWRWKPTKGGDTNTVCKS